MNLFSPSSIWVLEIEKKKKTLTTSWFLLYPKPAVDLPVH